jgi:hypothetical protein
MTAHSELFRALGAICEPPTADHRSLPEALGLEGEPAPGDYASVFLFQCYPYASIYLGSEGMLGGEAQDRVAGFWRAVGLVPPPEPDHLAALLGLYGALIDGEAAAVEPARAALRRASRRAFLWEHLLSWLPPYLDKVAELAPPYFAGWAGLLESALTAEAADLGPPEALPLQLREAPALPAPEEPAATWLGALLAAARSGMVVTRADLTRASRELGIGSRIGERAYMLRALFEQDAGATATWLAGEASRWALRHGSRAEALAPVGGFWKLRAEASAVALRTVAGGRMREPLAQGAG